MTAIPMPRWAGEMKKIFRSGTIGQFILFGNIYDLLPAQQENQVHYVALRHYLTENLFGSFDVVLGYDKGKGISVVKGDEHFARFLRVFDSFHRSKFSTDADAAFDPAKSLLNPGLLPRDPAKAIELLDRFIRGVPKMSGENKQLSVAIIIDYAGFILPSGDSLSLGDISGTLITVLDWAKDPSITSSNIATILLSETLSELNGAIVNNPHAAKIKIPLPDKEEIAAFVEQTAAKDERFKVLCQFSLPVLGAKLAGLSLVHIRNLIARSLKNEEMLTQKYLADIKKEIIEKESFDRLEFVESTLTLDDAAGHVEAKKWLREDALLLKRNANHALPMGYLITGRIGTGKTYLVKCFAGECGVPFVELKNFRDKWVGSTEANLEKIFSILHALGQVVVFVDEADQATGKRDSGSNDSGLSGRIYGMLAKEMADTNNRGKILWIFATSRPDMVEVDLKRQGRLDVHIPLFPPTDAAEKRELIYAMARKLKLPVSKEALPDLPFNKPISGNEIEGLLVRAVRMFELASEDPARKPLPEYIKTVLDEFRPSAHTEQLEMMDKLAVIECTDERFIPEYFKKYIGETAENG